MSFSPLIRQLIDGLRGLPGVGPKTAQRMALHLLERDRKVARHLAAALNEAMDGVGYCQKCRMLSETEICSLCSDPRRDDSLLCILQSPADVWAVEQAGGFNGRYFVLKGHLSPIDGQGPEEIGIPALLDSMEGRDVVEVILATNPTVEGEATAHYIAGLLRPRGIRVSRLAHGIPLGGELEFIDGGTLAHALAGRTPIAG
ncbi:recombination mediator RecR [Pseudomonas sp.]|uniref:recombination mediator RecR n=1 Tax=Pseudomonas sp. TaxID=306 RepID=UPI00272A70DD|nr:recombination mediator RecR [Pseudomonas sp.]